MFTWICFVPELCLVRMVNASYIDAAKKHKQAKQGSLGTES